MENQENNPIQTEEQKMQVENLEESVVDLPEDVEVESDEHESTDEYADAHQELPDFDQMSVNELITAAERLLEREDLQLAKAEMEALYQTAIKSLDEVRNEKLHAFVEDGGSEIDFLFEQPQRKTIVHLYREYKQKRRAYYQKLEEQLNLNLEVKQAIIEELRNLPNEEKSVGDKYTRFRELQERWHATGAVPRTASNELWNNFHHHVDNFYDFLRISNQLRDLDFKKNLEAKTELCVEAEALAEKDTDSDSFKVLQNLHAKWKRIGPVERELSEPLWQRFSEASKVVNDKRHEYYKQLRENREQLIAKKQEIVAQMAQVETDKLATHGAWQQAMKRMDALREAFKQVGRVNLPENDAVWESFREANRNFNRAKNQFYKALKADHQKNLEKKQALLDKANAIKDSDDWQATARALKQIQADWKQIGYVPKAESERIWKAFRSACNHFFDRLSAHNAKADAALEDNLVQKQALLVELKAWKSGEKQKEDVAALKMFIKKWKALGPVPRGKREIENEFNSQLDTHFKTLKLNKREAGLIKFENRVHSIIEGDNNREINRFKDDLKKQIEEAKNELRTLENNMLFFAHADEKSPIVKEARRNVARAKENVELLTQKLKMFNKTKDLAAATEVAKAKSEVENSSTEE